MKPLETPPIVDVQFTYMIRNDLKSIVDIELASFEYPWTEEDFLSFLRIRTATGHVVRRDGGVVAFVMWEQFDDYIKIANIAVSPQWRRYGIGRMMIDNIVRMCRDVSIPQVRMCVRETNLGAQLFARNCGFLAMSVMPKMYEECDEDGYEFVHYTL